MKKFCLCVSILLMFSGCSTIRGWMGLNEKKVKPVVAEVKKVPPPVKKKRMTRKTLAQQSQVGESAGSLWRMRGQSPYLFSQNTTRLIGDLLKIAIEGAPKKQIETKISVIEELIQDIQGQNKVRQLASLKKKEAEERRKREIEGADLKDPNQKSPEEIQTEKEIKQAEMERDRLNKKLNIEERNSSIVPNGSEFPVDLVSTRVVDILQDGSYNVEGDQIFMVGAREYKLSISGIVRQEDFQDEGISAENLLDPKFDVATKKRR